MSRNPDSPHSFQGPERQWQLLHCWKALQCQVEEIIIPQGSEGVEGDPRWMAGGGDLSFISSGTTATHNESVPHPLLLAFSRADTRGSLIIMGLKSLLGSARGCPDEPMGVSRTWTWLLHPLLTPCCQSSVTGSTRTWLLFMIK